MTEQKLIHIGFTNEAQVGYVTEQKEDGSFYPDSENGCYIPVYMLERHAHRAGYESKVHCELLRLHEENKALAAQVGAFKAVLEQQSKPHHANSDPLFVTGWREALKPLEDVYLHDPSQHLTVYDAEVSAQALQWLLDHQIYVGTVSGNKRSFVFAATIGERIQELRAKAGG